MRQRGRGGGRRGSWRGWLLKMVVFRHGLTKHDPVGEKSHYYQDDQTPDVRAAVARRQLVP